MSRLHRSDHYDAVIVGARAGGAELAASMTDEVETLASLDQADLAIVGR